MEGNEKQKEKKLSRTIQCALCPWKVSTNPRDIPNGYSKTLHKKLKSTIAIPGEMNVEKLVAEEFKFMACHHSTDNKADPCVGWLANQLGDGCNIGLRWRLVGYSNLKDLKVDGEQHKNFKDTLPKANQKKLDRKVKS